MIEHVKQVAGRLYTTVGVEENFAHVVDLGRRKREVKDPQPASSVSWSEYTSWLEKTTGWAELVTVDESGTIEGVKVASGKVTRHDLRFIYLAAKEEPEDVDAKPKDVTVGLPAASAKLRAEDSLD